MRLSLKLALAITAAAGLSVAAVPPATAPPASGIRPERLPAEGSWTGLQYLQADPSGRLFLLNPSTLDVFELTSAGALVKVLRLEPMEGDLAVRDAAMGRSPGQWVLFDFPFSVRWFEDGKETKTSELRWIPTAVAFRKTAPLVAVLPATVSPGQDVATGGVLDPSTPLVVEGSESKWEPAIENRERYPIPTGDPKDLLTRLRGTRQGRLTVDAKDRTWLALQGAYRLRRFSPSGQQDLELRVGDSVVKMVERSDQELEALRADLSKQGQEVSIERLSRVAAPNLIYGMTAARDGSLYVVHGVRDEKDGPGIQLDRFDPSALRLERVALTAVEGTRFTLASGKDGLYLAAGNAQGGRWRIRWDALDQAHWRAVAGAFLNGQPLEVEEEPATRRSPR